MQYILFLSLKKIVRISDIFFIFFHRFESIHPDKKLNNKNEDHFAYILLCYVKCDFDTFCSK